MNLTGDNEAGRETIMNANWLGLNILTSFGSIGANSAIALSLRDAYNEVDWR